MTKRVIYTNQVDFYPEAVKDAELAAEAEGATGKGKEQLIQERLDEENNQWFEDEQQNLDIPLDNQILVIADLGLWHGRRQGYKLLRQNIQAIFGATCGDTVEFYADAYNVHCTDVHHDGTNNYLFRELRGSEDECYPLIEAIYRGKPITKALLNRYSRSILPYVADVYGWPVAGRKRKVS